ncbi:MAG: malate synthase G, partial [Natronospirillum sp.]
MDQRIQQGGLLVAKPLHDLINGDILPGTGVSTEQFWGSLDTLVHDLTPVNQKLLMKRDTLQNQIDQWHRNNRGQPMDATAYRTMLDDIGYTLPEGPDFTIGTDSVDDEIARLAGPQLVVPVSNARFALNAANARWGSLYDALYSTNAIAEEQAGERSKGFNEDRAKRVISWTHEFLDQAVRLADGGHAEVMRYRLEPKGDAQSLVADLSDGRVTALEHPGQFVGFVQDTEVHTLLLANNGLHIELQVDHQHPIGRLSQAGIKDVVLESALSTTMDCEDSVAAVNAFDKVAVYRNWLGLMKGDLNESITKNGKQFTRSLNPDRLYQAPDGQALTLHGRSMMLVRNVGHLMTTDAIVDRDGQEIPEGILDAMVTTACALHDLRKDQSALRNSRSGSLYIVKPKMHGPEEVAFTNHLFDQVEDALGLPRHTVKVGVMDEERRTTVNLKECIREVKDRLVFINTGFLDRTGDEIHTGMEAGPLLRKEDIKNQPWIQAYEDWNVDIGLACG